MSHVMSALPPRPTALPSPGLFTVRIVTLLLLIAILAVSPAGIALAQDGSGVSEAFSGIVTTITDIIQSLSVVVGILGISLWGFGKLARPVFPEISQLTSQYITQFMIGLVAVYLASTVVEAIASAIGAA